MKQYIPNCLSISRVAALPVLYILLLNDKRNAFFIVLILAALTDLLDGFLARKWDATSDLGKKLDSLADLLFFLSVLFFAWVLYPEIIRIYAVPILMITGLRILLIIWIFIRHNHLHMLHTWLNKAAGLLVFIFVSISVFYISHILIITVLTIGLLSILEEIGIYLKYGLVDPDTTSILVIKKESDLSTDYSSQKHL